MCVCVCVCVSVASCELAVLMFAPMDAVITARLACRGAKLGTHQRLAAGARPAVTSVLARRLVEVWSWGLISSPTLQWLAEGSVLDLDSIGYPAEPVKQDLSKLASIGSSGAWAGNTRRDLLKHCFAKVMLPQPLSIRVPYIQNASRRMDIDYTDASIVMPNELFDCLYTHYNDFFRTYVAVDLPQFWGGVSLDDPVAHGHPAMARPEYRTSAVPFMILGDKVQYTDDEQSLHVLAWSPIINTFSSVWHRIFLLAAFPAQACCKENVDGVSTMRVFWKYAAHGFTALCRGTHPDKDPDGYPWPAGSYQAFLAGKPIAGGKFFGAMWGLSSDLEYAVAEWGVPHWNAHNPCLHCRASRTDAALNIRDVSMNAPWRATCRAAVDRAPPSGNPAWLIPGASSFSYRGEWMHVWEEGILKDLHACALHDLLDGPFAGHGGFDNRLAALQRAFARHAKDRRLRRLLKRKHLGSPTKIFPVLCFCKAWEAKELVAPLLGLLYEVNDGSENLLHLVRVYECLHAVILCLEQPGLFLDRASAEALNRNAEEFVQQYDWLTQNSGTTRYNPRFKLHWLLHLSWSARWLHPRATWTYAFEDFCGRMKRLAIACMRSTPKYLISKKISTQYRIALHCHAQPLRA